MSAVSDGKSDKAGDGGTPDSHARDLHTPAAPPACCGRCKPRSAIWISLSKVADVRRSGRAPRGRSTRSGVGPTASVPWTSTLRSSMRTSRAFAAAIRLLMKHPPSAQQEQLTTHRALVEAALFLRPVDHDLMLAGRARRCRGIFRPAFTVTIKSAIDPNALRVRPALRRPRRAAGRGRPRVEPRRPQGRDPHADAGVTRMPLLTLLDAEGATSTAELAEAPSFTKPTAPLRSRVAYAAAHVVPKVWADNTPGSPPRSTGTRPSRSAGRCTRGVSASPTRWTPPSATWDWMPSPPVSSSPAAPKSPAKRAARSWSASTPTTSPRGGSSSTRSSTRTRSSCTSPRSRAPVRC